MGSIRVPGRLLLPGEGGKAGDGAGAAGGGEKGGNTSKYSYGEGAGGY